MHAAPPLRPASPLFSALLYLSRSAFRPFRDPHLQVRFLRAKSYRRGSRAPAGPVPFVEWRAAAGERRRQHRTLHEAAVRVLQAKVAASHASLQAAWTRGRVADPRYVRAVLCSTDGKSRYRPHGSKTRDGRSAATLPWLPLVRVSDR